MGGAGAGRRGCGLLGGRPSRGADRCRVRDRLLCNWKAALRLGVRPGPPLGARAAGSGNCDTNGRRGVQMAKATGYWACPSPCRALVPGPAGPTRNPLRGTDFAPGSCFMPSHPRFGPRAGRPPISEAQAISCGPSRSRRPTGSDSESVAGSHGANFAARFIMIRGPVPAMRPSGSFSRSLPPHWQLERFGISSCSLARPGPGRSDCQWGE